MDRRSILLPSLPVSPSAHSPSNSKLAPACILRIDAFSIPLAGPIVDNAGTSIFWVGPILPSPRLTLTEGTKQIPPCCRARRNPSSSPARRVAHLDPPQRPPGNASRGKPKGGARALAGRAIHQGRPRVRSRRSVDGRNLDAGLLRVRERDTTPSPTGATVALGLPT
jgi:hypothetical protein